MNETQPTSIKHQISLLDRNLTAVLPTGAR